MQYSKSLRISAIAGVLIAISQPLLSMRVGAEPTIPTDGRTPRKNFGSSDPWVAKFADQPTANKPIWAQQFGSSSIDFTEDAAADLNGNIVLTGDTRGALSGTNKGGEDLWVAKVSPTGKVLWKRQWGTDEDETGRAIATDPSGNIFVAGRIRVSTLFSTDYFTTILKYSPAGNLLWRKEFEIALEGAIGLTVDRNGNAYLTGRTSSVVDPGDNYMAKFSPTGTREWLKYFSFRGSTLATDIAVDSRGNLLVTGNTSDSPGGPNKGGVDSWIARFSSQGTLRWIKQFGTAQDDYAESIAVDSVGNILAMGDVRSSVLPEKVWVVKYKSDGTFLWRQQLDSSALDYPSNVTVDAKNNVFLGGLTGGSLGGPIRGNVDAWAAKYSPAGKLVWKKQFGTLFHDGFIEGVVVVDNKGSVFLAGGTEGDVLKP